MCSVLFIYLFFKEGLCYFSHWTWFNMLYAKCFCISFKVALFSVKHSLSQSCTEILLSNASVCSIQMLQTWQRHWLCSKTFIGTILRYHRWAPNMKGVPKCNYVAVFFFFFKAKRQHYFFLCGEGNPIMHFDQLS